MTRPQIVLASTSPYRRQLMEKLRLPFDTAAPDCDETRGPDESPAALVERLAHAKAASISDTLEDPALVIGSDQVAALGDRILEKPEEHDRAVEQLQACSGQRVGFYTGLALIDTRAHGATSHVEHAVYWVTFRTLDQDEIERYLATEAPYDCAGSIRSEGYAVTLFESMQGTDPNALVGLPLIRLAALLRDAGIPLP